MLLVVDLVSFVAGGRLVGWLVGWLPADLVEEG